VGGKCPLTGPIKPRLAAAAAAAADRYVIPSSSPLFTQTTPQLVIVVDSQLLPFRRNLPISGFLELHGFRGLLTDTSEHIRF